MATNAVYEKRGTTITFINTGGDKVLDIDALAQVTGRISPFVDRGANAAPCDAEVRAWAAWEANPTVNETMDVYIVQSDGTHQDGDGIAYDASNDAAVTAAALAGLTPAVVVSVQVADTATKGNASRVRFTSRYYATAIFNRSAAKDLATGNGTSGVAVTPLYPDIQAAA